MGWISKLKDHTYYIDFDRGCIFDPNGCIVAEIQSDLCSSILLYFAENPEIWLKKDRIISNCWPDDTSDNSFYKTMSSIYGIHEKVRDSIENTRSMGYKYHGLRKEKKNSEEQKSNNKEGDVSTTEKPPSSSIEKAIRLAGLKIDAYEITQGRKPLGAEAEKMIRDIIDAVMDNLFDDILGISARVWSEYNFMQQAQAIVRVYINEMSSIHDYTRT